ncbi:MAG: NUDIX domain-containing protein [Planctomycetota bacterium]|nr:NUDIX domain-containing protein [Planctomycetota bacterium]MCX8039748.1 NUDIX domain-containing protein [Planctomycetota bacterium]MDW8373226.1 NUDIX domain-containing protein [Planctomycetota bacterium]
MPATRVRAAGLFLRTAARPWRWLLLCHRQRGEWGFPKGHCEAGEDAWAAALRECAEETGIGLVAIAGAPLAISYRLGDGRLKEVVYYPAYTAQQRVRLSREHRAWAWCDLAAVRARIPHLNLLQVFNVHVHALPSA